ncbi:hypothetical protein KPH14_012972, partial [Odynerus spinipes]
MMVGRPPGSKNKVKDKSLEVFMESKEKLPDQDDRMGRMLKVMEEMKKGLEEGFAKIVGELRDSFEKQLEKLKKQFMEEKEDREAERKKEKEEWNKEKEELLERLWLLES